MCAIIVPTTLHDSTDKMGTILKATFKFLIGYNNVCDQNQ